jgi:hypothetical protein
MGGENFALNQSRNPTLNEEDGNRQQILIKAQIL